MQNTNKIQAGESTQANMKDRVLELEEAMAELLDEFRHFQIDEDLIKYEEVLRKRNQRLTKPLKPVFQN